MLPYGRPVDNTSFRGAARVSAQRGLLDGKGGFASLFSCQLVPSVRQHNLRMVPLRKAKAVRNRGTAGGMDYGVIVICRCSQACRGIFGHALFRMRDEVHGGIPKLAERQPGMDIHCCAGGILHYPRNILNHASPFFLAFPPCVLCGKKNQGNDG